MSDRTAVPETSLPAWIYRDPGFFELERERVFAQAWQVVCHLNDIPQAGDYQTLDFLNERVVVLRGDDGAVRAFHNVCRHRAARLADGTGGNCGHRLVCPYHAWSYGLDGRLAAVPPWQGFEDLDLSRYGLRPVEHEVFLGFIFVRFAPGLPSVAEMMGAYAAEIEPYDFESLVPQGRVTLRMREVNWKNVADNYSDGLHITVGHPGLTRLFGRGYGIEARPWVDKMLGALLDTPSANWSERRYQAFLPDQERLPPERRRLWSYYKLWPNVAFDVYPDQVDFMQFIPVSATQTLIREIAYVRPDEDRRMRAARYLNWRINRRVSLEDKDLIERVQDGMNSSSYVSGPLSRHEVCLASFARRMRELIPEARLERPPANWGAPTPLAERKAAE
jgi:phenylpropionate dioxygenase-like ring-hydroxylating dioxygenase large terminal subunit